jgi:hypothetical protein
MPDANVVEMIFRRSDQLLWLWNFYVVVVVAALAAAASWPGFREKRAWRFGLMFLFAFVAYANLESMRWVLKQWHALADANPELTRGPMTSVIEAPHPLWVFPFHLILDAFVLVGIWNLTQPRERK